MIKTLPYDKLKAFVVDKIDVTEKLKFVSGGVESAVWKGESAGYYQHFFFFSFVFPLCFFTRHLFQGRKISGLSGEEAIYLYQSILYIKVLTMVCRLGRTRVQTLLLVIFLLGKGTAYLGIQWGNIFYVLPFNAFLKCMEKIAETLWESRWLFQVKGCWLVGCIGV